MRCSFFDVCSAVPPLTFTVNFCACHTRSAGVRVQLLETATTDGRGKQRLKVQGAGLVGWVSVTTGSGKEAMEGVLRPFHQAPLCAGCR